MLDSRRTKEQIARDLHFIQDVRKVFGEGGSGRVIFECLLDRYYYPPMLSKDPIELAANAGCRDLVGEFVSILNDPDVGSSLVAELRHLEEVEKRLGGKDE